MSTFKGIAAMANNRVIGLNGKLPWSYPLDLQIFKERTMGGNLIVGFNTFKGLPKKGLPGRNIFVLLKQGIPEDQLQGIVAAPGTRFLTFENLPENDYWVCGGAKTYSLLLPKMSEFYLTRITQDHEGDTIMPPFENHFKEHEVILANQDFDIIRYYNPINQ